MIKDQYYTLSKLSIAEFKDRGSRFISYAFPCESIQEFESEQEKIKKEHFKARHHCYAYRLGIDGEVFRANDDGEPGGTAGLPILNQLKSNEVVNVGCIVVRYFGGTKLGASGLINAYKSSASESIKEGNKVLKIIGDELKIGFDYSQMGILMDTIKKNELNIVEKHFEAVPHVTLQIRRSIFEESFIKLKAELLNISIEEYMSTEPKMEHYKFEIIEQ
jgi:uncharacterized YigZ family protein